MLGKKAQVFSVNPGVIMTPLGANIDWAGEFGDISKFSFYADTITCFILLIFYLVRIDLELGNDEAVNGWPKYKSKEAGIATAVYASFDQDLAGEHSNIWISGLRLLLTRMKTTLARISWTARFRTHLCIPFDHGHLVKSKLRGSGSGRRSLPMRSSHSKSFEPVVPLLKIKEIYTHHR